MAKNKKQQANKVQATKVKDPVKPLLSNRSLLGILLTTVVLITFIIYYSNLTDHFVNFDDTRSVCENPIVLSPPTAQNIKTIFTTYSPDGNYDPLVRLSFMIDYSLYDFTKTHAPTPQVTINPQVQTAILAISQPDYLGASGYHLTCLILHCLSVILLFFLCYRLSNSVWVGAMVALLFGIHPMHVESVAWISERKDQLYVLFYFAAMLTYLNYFRNTKWRVGYLCLTGLFFLLSLFSKGQAVTLPIALLLIDYYEAIKFNLKTIAIKIPFFLLSIVFGAIAVMAEKSINSFQSADVSYPFLDRILFASYALVTYLWKLILPIHLSAFYPYPVKTGSAYPALIYISPVIILAIIALLVFKFRKSKLVVFGTLFFLVNIVLLTQLLPVGDAIVAERYSYLPYTGLFFIAAVLLVNYFQNKSLSSDLRSVKPFVAGLLVIYFAFLGYTTYAQTGVWQNSKSLWQNAYKTFPATERICGNLSEVYLSEFKIDSALYYLDAATKLRSTQAYSVRSAVYIAIGQFDLALADCNYVINNKLLPFSSAKLYDIYLNRAHIYTIKNKLDSALDDCNHALDCSEMLGHQWSAYQDRGIVLMTAGKLDFAANDFRQSLLQGNPNVPGMYVGIGNTFNMRNQPDSAIVNFTKAIQANHNYAPAYYQRSVSYQQQGNYEQELNDLLIAQKLGLNVDSKTINDLQIKVNSSE